MQFPHSMAGYDRYRRACLQESRSLSGSAPSAIWASAYACGRTATPVSTRRSWAPRNSNGGTQRSCSPSSGPACDAAPAGARTSSSSRSIRPTRPGPLDPLDLALPMSPLPSLDHRLVGMLTLLVVLDLLNIGRFGNRCTAARRIPPAAPLPRTRPGFLSRKSPEARPPIGRLKHPAPRNGTSRPWILRVNPSAQPSISRHAGLHTETLGLCCGYQICSELPDCHESNSRLQLSARPLELVSFLRWNCDRETS